MEVSQAGHLRNILLCQATIQQSLNQTLSEARLLIWNVLGIRLDLPPAARVEILVEPPPIVATREAKSIGTFEDRLHRDAPVELQVRQATKRESAGLQQRPSFDSGHKELRSKPVGLVLGLK